MKADPKPNPVIELQRNLINELSKISDFNDMLKVDLVYTMCNFVLNSIQENIKTDASSIWLRVGETDRHDAIMFAGSGYQQGFVRKASVETFPANSDKCTQIVTDRERRIGITSWVISKGASLLIPSNIYPEIQQHPFWGGKFDKDQHKYASLEIEAFLAVPIRRKDGFILGVIKCERLKNSVNAIPFQTDERVLLEALARVAAKCKMYYNEINTPETEQFPGEIRKAIRDKIDKVIKSWTHELLMDAFNFEDNTDNYLVEAAKIIQSATNSHSCAIFLIDKDNKTITQRGGSGYQELRKVVRSYPLSQKQFEDCRKQGQLGICNPLFCSNSNSKKQKDRCGLTAWIAVSEMAFIARNRETLIKHCHHIGAYDKLNFDFNFVCGAFIGYPLRIGGKVIGVLKIEKQTKKNSNANEDLFDDTVVNRALAISNEISYIISKIDDVNIKRMEIYKKSDTVIAAILQAGQDVNQLIKMVVTQTKELFNARACALYLKVGDKLIQPEWAALGWTKSYTQSHQFDIVPESAISPDPVAIEEIKTLSSEKYADVTKKLTESDEISFFKDCYIKEEGKKPKYCLNNATINDNDKLTKLQTILKEIKFNRIGLTVWIAVKKEKFIARSFEELKAHPHHRGTFDSDNFVDDEKCESFMGIPLIVNENEVLGVLKVETKMKPRKAGMTDEYDFFSAQDEFLFELIAQITAIAIENARRFEEERLFLQLVKEKEPNTIFKILSDFIKGRHNVKDKLLEIAAVFRTFDKSKVKLIDCFIALLNSPSSIENLVKIRNLLKDPLLDHIATLEKALKIEKIDDIPKFSIENTLNPQSFTNNYDVYHTPMILDNDLFERIGKKINNYLTNNYNKIELFSAIDDLVEQRNKINGFIFGIEGVVFRVVLDKLIKEISDTAKKYIEITSPYLVGPALPGRSKLFFGRESTFSEIRTNLDQRAIILSGQGRIGKTSLINQFKSDELKKIFSDAIKVPIYPIIIDMHKVSHDKLKGLLFGISETIYNEFKSQGYNVSAPRSESFEDNALEAIVDYFKLVYEISSMDNIRILYIFDEYEKIYEIDKHVEGSSSKFHFRLRDIIDTCINALFIFVGRSSPQEIPADFYQTINAYCTPMTVGLLEDDAANKLIIDPVSKFGVQFEDEAIEEILKETCNHPLLIQSICNKCIVKLNEKKYNAVVTNKMAKEAINQIIENENALFEDLSKFLDAKHPEYADKIFSEFISTDTVSLESIQKHFTNINELKEKLNIFCKKMILRQIDGDTSKPSYGIMIPMFKAFIRRRFR